jgi:hypothetical protein
MTLGLQCGGFESGRSGGQFNIMERVLEYAVQLCWVVMILAATFAAVAARTRRMASANAGWAGTGRRDGGRRY